MRNGMIRALPVVAATFLGIASAALAAEIPPQSAPGGTFDTLQRGMLVMKDRLGVMLSAIPELPDIGPFLVRRLTSQYEPNHIWVLGLELAVILIGALIGEAAARRLFLPMHRFLPVIDARTEFRRLGALLVNAVIRSFELAAFVLVAVGLFFAIYDGHEAARYAFWCVFSIIVLVRLIAIGLRVLLAPSLPDLRLAELDNRTARRLYRRLVLLAALVIGAGLVSIFLYNIGLPERLHLAAGTVLTLAATCGIITMIWGERRTIARLIGVHPADDVQRRDLAALF